MYIVQWQGQTDKQHVISVIGEESYHLYLYLTSAYCNLPVTHLATDVSDSAWCHATLVYIPHLLVEVLQVGGVTLRAEQRTCQSTAPHLGSHLPTTAHQNTLACNNLHMTYKMHNTIQVPIQHSLAVESMSMYTSHDT